MITPMESIQPLSKLVGNEMGGSVKETEDASGGFRGIFQSAVDNLVQADREKSELQYQLSVGELDNPALLTTAIAKNQIALDILIQLRNKALDVYSEITRISL